MKHFRAALLTFLFIYAFGLQSQNNKIAGLYNECNGQIGGYMCQQLLLLEDSTFIFYDLLHLRGWKLTRGSWSTIKDTLILNSLSNGFNIQYFGNSDADSVVVRFFVDSTNPQYGTIITDKVYTLDSLGRAITNKTTTECTIEFLAYPKSSFSFDSIGFYKAESIRVDIESDSLQFYNFQDEKFLFDKRNIYFRKDSFGGFDRNAFFRKTSLKNLRYENQ